VNEKETAMMPFAAPDECEGVYGVETRTVIEIKKYRKHTYRKLEPSEVGQAAGKKLINIDFNNKNKPSARRIAHL